MLAPPDEGRGECRVFDAPAVSRAKWVESTRGSSPWVHRTDPAFPHAMVLTGSFVLSPVIGLVVTVICVSKHRFDASVEASGPHDFAVRLGVVRQRHLNVHCIPPRVRDDRDTPLWWDETGGTTVVICVARKPKYSSKWGWTGKSVICRRTISDDQDRSPHERSDMRVRGRSRMSLVLCARESPTRLAFGQPPSPQGGGMSPNADLTCLRTY
jgi:hypothetical protein